nr:DEAD/DEAH box helicase [Clostridium senegalense]
MENILFEDLNLDEHILKALKNLGFNKPSQVQEKAIPYLLRGEDIIVKSQTGSGKTASFGIPLCEKTQVENSVVQSLVLVPTRELAMQVKEDISNIGRLKKVRAAAIFGKQPFNDQIRELKQRVHIVIGTPGRVIDHINRGTLKIDNINFVVIDEADKMLNMGFIDQIKEILNEIPKERVTSLFSATIEKEIENLSKNYMKSPEVLNVESKVLNKAKIEESYLHVEDKQKFKALWTNIYSEIPDSAIVFCNTKDKVKYVYGLMKREGFLVEELHGDMLQNERMQVMEKFKNKEFKILVATDIAARGIHVDSITHVFNYEVPMEKESYVHRIGRTGRAGKEGKAITFVDNYEKRFLKQIEEYVGHEIKEGEFPTDEKVREGKKKFKESQNDLKDNKKKISKETIHSDVVKLYINGGKKKKIRVIDIVGAISNLEGITGDDIGIIDVQDGCSFVDILNGKGKKLLSSYKEISVKGKKVKIQKAKK